MNPYLYKSRPDGCSGADAISFLRNSRLRSLFASFCLRWRLKRALSPFSADIRHQRGSRRCRGGPPPRLPRNEPPPKPPPCDFGLPSFTFRARPSKFSPFSSVIARSACATSVISTKANPRDRPVPRSVTRFTHSTLPYRSNSVRTEASVALKSKLPTKMFFI